MKLVLHRLVLAVLALAAFGAAAADRAVYTLAILPSQPAVTMNALWSPFVERLSKATGLEFRLKHYERTAEFERDIWSGMPDFIFSSPIQAVVAHVSSGYVPLVHARKPVSVGLYVREDSPIRSVDDLVGKKISFVGNKNVCSVTLQHLLAKKDKVDFGKEYAGTTRNVIISVLLGKTDAGAVFEPEMSRESADTRRQLRKVVETPPMGAHPLSASPRVPRQVQEAVTQAVLAMAATPVGAALLATLKLEDPVRADYRKDYAALEEIDIRGATNWGH
ncbi:MAG TPA: phosphate/phosphite/phosphonate ABC transporter substrate-binding protein [Rhodocyclaceae bacterium]